MMMLFMIILILCSSITTSSMTNFIVTVVCDGEAYILTSADGQVTTKTDLPMSKSSQKETVSR